MTKSAVLVTFTEETLNEKLQFLCSNKASIQGLIKFRLVLMMVLYRRSLYEKYPNSEFFLARMFPYSDLIWRFIFKIFILIQNTGKYGPKKNSLFGQFSRSGNFYIACVSLPNFTYSRYFFMPTILQFIQQIMC